MKMFRIILIAFLTFIVLPLPCLAGMENAAAKPALQNDIARNISTNAGTPLSLNRNNQETGKGAEQLARIDRRHHFQTQKARAGKNAGKPVSVQRMTPLRGYVTLAQGEAVAQLGGKGNWAALRTGDIIPPQSNLRTGRSGALEIRYEDGSSLLLRSETEVTILEAWKTRTSRLLRDFFLSAGRVIAKVQSATGQSPRFRVHTPSAIASVRGTQFRVSVDNKQKTFVEVLESKVTVDTATNIINLAQGEGAMIKNAPLPPSPRKLLAPPSPMGLQPLYKSAPVFSFERIDGARAYRVMAAKDQQGKQVVRECVIKPGEILTMTGLADGSYYLLTQSIDSIGLEGPPSSAYPFAVRENPLPPIILIPGDGPKAGEKTAILEWLAVGDAVRYHLQIAEDKEFRKLILDKADLMVVTFKAEGLENKPYTFRIRSIARDDYPGAWSDPVVMNLSPQPSASSENTPVRSLEKISLRFRDAGEGFSYHVQIARDDQFKEVLIDQKVNTPEISIDKPKEAGVYFIRIAAIDRDGKTGGYSQPQGLTIQNRFPYEWVGGGTGVLLLLLLLAL